MKKFFQWTGIILGAIIVIVAIAAAYVMKALPDVGPPPAVTIKADSATVARGAYLAEHVMVCMDCHSKRQEQFFAMPMDPATLGQGGIRFDKSVGFPGEFYSRNITPAGIGGWSDGEVYRAITTGVKKDGQPIFPVMPYGSYGLADPEDVKAVIAYLRRIPARENAVPESHADFPMNFIMHLIPKKATPSVRPPAEDSIAQGKYLLTIAACHDCHTPVNKGKFVDELAFAGGREFATPAGLIRSANITPDSISGVGQWSRELFILKFAQYRDSAKRHLPVLAGQKQSIMPWIMYAGMTDHDLGNLYAYIRTLTPISHTVKSFEPAK